MRAGWRLKGLCAHIQCFLLARCALRASSVCLLSIDYYFQRLAISITVCLSVSVHRRAVPFTFTVHARDGSFRLFLRLGGRSFRFFHSRRRSASVAGTYVAMATASSPRRGVPSVRNEYAAWVLSTFMLGSNNFTGLPFYYVDLAANEPVEGSNTHELEERGWRGLCIEPNPQYVKLLRAQRRCALAPVAVDGVERNIQFHNDGTVGGIQDPRFDNRAGSKDLQAMRTRLLQDVLREASAPHVIHYLSLDVEGAESAALPDSFAWDDYVFLTLSIERPPPDLNRRLFRHGYLFVRRIGIADALYVHWTHPYAAKVSANASFAQAPAKCSNGHGTRYRERTQLRRVACQSIFGCCTWKGFPESSTKYMGAISGKKVPRWYEVPSASRQTQRRPLEKKEEGLFSRFWSWFWTPVRAPWSGR